MSTFIQLFLHNDGVTKHLSYDASVVKKKDTHISERVRTWGEKKDYSRPVIVMSTPCLRSYKVGVYVICHVCLCQQDNAKSFCNAVVKPDMY